MARRAVTLSVALAVAAILLLPAVSAVPFRKMFSSIADRANPLIDPGPLAEAHAHDKRLQDCNACHDPLHGLPDGLCLKCHEEIGRRSGVGAGYHGTFRGACVGCHRDHLGREAKMISFDEKAFNHNQASYRLRGKHGEVECRKCHEKREEDGEIEFRYTGIDSVACLSCHRDPHQGQLGSECTTCHSEEGWKGKHLVFDHQQHARFKLDPLHKDIACASCHEKERYKPLETSCVGCHTNYPAVMSGVSNGGGEAIKSPHAVVSCEKCHAPSAGRKGAAEYRADCIRCHHEGYGKLYYEWRNDLDELIRAVEEELRSAELAGDREACERLARAAREGRLIGMHNIHLAKQILSAALR